MTSPRSMCSARHDPDDDRAELSAVGGELTRPVEIATGVTLTWDPAQPYHCVDVDVPDEARLREWSVAPVDTLPWLRLAATTVLDRLLYLPLDRSLLDAELAAAQLAAARTLSAGEPARERLVRKALVGARTAAGGVVAYLEGLSSDRRRLPSALVAGVDMLIRSYAELAAEVHEFDSTLDAVVEAGHGLASVECSTRPTSPAVVAPAVTEPTQRGVTQVDPRSIPARVLQFGPTCDTAEISVVPVREDAGPAVRIGVDAFFPTPTSDETVDVGVRLVDHRSGKIRGWGVLARPRSFGAATASDGTRPRFEGRVALPASLAAGDVRVDLFDVTEGKPPTRAEDCDLRRARRATLFLAGWRALVVDVRLWGVRAEPAARLREIVSRLTDDCADVADGPLWSGGPALSELTRLVEAGDRTLTSRVREASMPTGSPTHDGDSVDVVETVSGPGDLLTAEVAAAYDRSRPSLDADRRGQ